LATSSDGSIRAALGAVIEAIRSGYGPNAERAQDRADGGHDLQFLERTAPLLEFMWSRYFRVRLIGIEHVPDTGAALLVGNHSGGIPYDGAMLLYAVYRDHPRHRRVRPLVANFAFRSGWMANVVARIGCVRASTETALPLLASGNLVAVFPEGLKGVGKMYRERYRLARFGRGGFVRLARQAQVTLKPVAVVGAEEICPCPQRGPSLSVLPPRRPHHWTMW
jgi:1-acyl-sn-glycerol-3-phosphate acyltransferase